MRFQMHPVNPQKRLMKQVSEILRKDGIIVFPTDAGYSLGCLVSQKRAIQRLYDLKRHDKKYFMTLMIHDFSDLNDFAKLENFAYRYMKSYLPGPFTFILPAEKKIQRILDVKRPEIGVRMPKTPFFETLQEFEPMPLLSVTARLSDEDVLIDPDEIESRFGKLVDLIIDMGPVPLNPTTVISLVEGEARLIREGAGEVNP